MLGSIVVGLMQDMFGCSFKGCSKGPHNKEKPPEPEKPEGNKEDGDNQKTFNERVIQAPKPLEAIQRPR